MNQIPHHNYRLQSVRTLHAQRQLRLRQSFLSRARAFAVQTLALRVFPQHPREVSHERRERPLIEARQTSFLTPRAASTGLCCGLFNRFYRNSFGWLSCKHTPPVRSRLSSDRVWSSASAPHFYGVLATYPPPPLWILLYRSFLNDTFEYSMLV